MKRSATSPQSPPGSQHLDEVLGRATAAFPAWSEMPASERARAIRRVRHAIVRNQEGIAQTIVEETGKPITEVAAQEVTATLEMLRYSERAYPRWLQERRFRYWRPGFWTKSNTVYFEPLGVVAIIGPSNFPFSLPVMQACAALMCGNCVIVKPAHQCPHTAAMIGDAFAEAEFPEGLVSVIEGSGEVVEHLIGHQHVHKIIFTGSHTTGSRVAELCGQLLKPSVLELGGSGAAIVCEDADIRLAARGVGWSAFYAGGRSCVGTKRLFLIGEAGQPFVTALREEIKSINIGNQLNPNAEMGQPGEDSTTQLRDLVHDAVARGASIMTRTDVTPEADLGNNADPLILLQASPEMRVMREEVNGPLLAVRQVDSIDQAICEVNDSPFGLSASVWSRNHRRARDIAARLRVGMVWINDSSIGMPGFPWGGVKHSGWGRLFSCEGVSELTNVKVISCDRRRSSAGKLWWFPYSPEKYRATLSVNRLAFGGRMARQLQATAKALWKLWRSR